MPDLELATVLGPLANRLRCIDCGGRLRLTELVDEPSQPELGPDGQICCTSCSRVYPLIAGSPRMLPLESAGALLERYPKVPASAIDGGRVTREATVQAQTARSFAYEWEQFGGLRSEWQKNFEDYLRPHVAGDLARKAVLDVGAGSGRHSYYAAEAGADVVAVDIGPSIDVARRNLPPQVLTVQADAERLPFEAASFDFVMAIGVLHHLTDPGRALKAVAQFAKPEGTVHVYLYWRPERLWHRGVLQGVTAARRLTTRLPHPVLRLLCTPIAALLYVGVVAPYRLLSRWPATSGLAEALPLQFYVDYPFEVLVNDQFDRFSAPIEHRFSRAEVARLLEAAGCRDVVVLPNHGWIGDAQRMGIRPALSPAAQPATASDDR